MDGAIDLNESERKKLDDERTEVLEQLEDWLETPMVVLGFVWMLLLIVDLIWGLNPFLLILSDVIWAIFIVDFIVEFILAPQKINYLKVNWITAISLLVPAIRVLRAVRIVRAMRATSIARGTRLMRLMGSLNRSMRALGTAMGRRRFGYVLMLTLIVTLSGAAGMYAFEREASTGGFESYGSSLWWTAMIITTMGTYWPVTPEGQMLSFILAVYAFTVFGYVTATLATFFIELDKSREEGHASAGTIEELRREVAALRDEIHSLCALKKD